MTHLIHNALWRLVYVEYWVKYPNFMFAKETLKDFLFHALKKLTKFQRRGEWKGNILMWWSARTFESHIPIPN
jgi:hypothetical protein